MGAVSTISAERLALAAALAGEPADLTTAPNFEAIKALPAVIVEPAVASWIDASSDSGPGRMVRYGVTVHVVVNAQEPIGALVDVEDCVERVLERVPPTWRIDRAEGPQRKQASGGELTALSAAISLSMRYSITGNKTKPDQPVLRQSGAEFVGPAPPVVRQSGAEFVEGDPLLRQSGGQLVGALRGPEQQPERRRTP